MSIGRIGNFVMRAALVASTALFSACSPGSISAPPPMRPLVPEGPALAGRHVGLSRPVAPARVAL